MYGTGIVSVYTCVADPMPDPQDPYFFGSDQCCWILTPGSGIRNMVFRIPDPKFIFESLVTFFGVKTKQHYNF
jgi:hypothetical protein